MKDGDLRSDPVLGGDAGTIGKWDAGTIGKWDAGTMKDK